MSPVPTTTIAQQEINEEKKYFVQSTAAAQPSTTLLTHKEKTTSPASLPMAVDANIYMISELRIELHITRNSASSGTQSIVRRLYDPFFYSGQMSSIPADKNNRHTIITLSLKSFEEISFFLEKSIEQIKMDMLFFNFDDIIIPQNDEEDVLLFSKSKCMDAIQHSTDNTSIEELKLFRNLYNIKIIYTAYHKQQQQQQQPLSRSIATKPANHDDTPKQQPQRIQFKLANQHMSSNLNPEIIANSQLLKYYDMLKNISNKQKDTTTVATDPILAIPWPSSSAGSDYIMIGVWYYSYVRIPYTADSLQFDLSLVKTSKDTPVALEWVSKCEFVCMHLYMFSGL